MAQAERYGERNPEEEIMKAFQLFDADGSGKISLGPARNSIPWKSVRMGGEVSQANRGDVWNARSRAELETRRLCEVGPCPKSDSRCLETSPVV